MRENGDPTSADPSTIRADSQIAKRIRFVAEELIDYASGKDENPFSGHMWFIKSIFQIFFDEMTDKDDEKIAVWMDQFAVLLQWCSTGDDTLLPPEVMEYMRMRYPDDTLAITAGSD